MYVSKPLTFTYAYNWKHVPSGQSGVKTGEFYSKADFVAEVAKMNAKGGGWQYWVTKGWKP